MNMAEVRESSDEVAIDGAVDSPPRAFEDNLDFQEVFPKTSRIVLGPDEYYRTQASDTALNHPGHNAVSLEFTVDLSSQSKISRRWSRCPKHLAILIRGLVLWTYSCSTILLSSTTTTSVPARRLLFTLTPAIQHDGIHQRYGHSYLPKTSTSCSPSSQAATAHPNQIHALAVPHGTNSKTVASPLTRQTATPRTCPRTAKDRAGAICSVCGSCEDERRRPTRTCHGNALRATGVLDDVNGQKIRDLQEHAFDELNGTGATPSPSEYIDLRDGGVPDASVLPDPYSFPSAWTTFTEEA